MYVIWVMTSDNWLITQPAVRPDIYGGNCVLWVLCPGPVVLSVKVLIYFCVAVLCPGCQFEHCMFAW